MNRDQIIQRLKEMRETPEMWAWGEEAFVFQIATLMEVLGYDQEQLTTFIIDANPKFDSELTEERGQVICDIAFAIMGYLNS